MPIQREMAAGIRLLRQTLTKRLPSAKNTHFRITEVDQNEVSAKIYLNVRLSNNQLFPMPLRHFKSDRSLQ